MVNQTTWVIKVNINYYRSMQDGKTDNMGIKVDINYYRSM